MLKTMGKAINTLLLLGILLCLGCGQEESTTQLLSELNPALTPAQSVETYTSPLTLPNPSELEKEVAYLEQDRAKDGAAFEADVPFTFANLAASELHGVYSPQWTGEPGTSLIDLAFGMYSFTLPDFDLDGTLEASWLDGFAPRDGQAWYIGLANFNFDAWHWVAGTPDGAVPVGEFAPYLSPTGVALVVVAVLGSDECRLEQVRIGGNILPAVDVQVDVTYGPPALVVNFDASASLDYDGEIALYSWDFDGDGTPELEGATETQVQHTYNTSGDYPATLTATDAEGGTSEAVVNIAVNLPPTASLSADPLVGSAPLSVSFNAGGSSDPEDQLTDILWDLDGNGSFNEAGSEQSNQGQALVDFTYIVRGLFNPAVKVIDHHGEEDIATIEVSVNAPPNAILSATPLIGQVPIDVAFDASSSTDSDGAVEDYEWDFDGDGMFNEAGGEEDSRGNETPTFHYTEQGGYSATLRVTDNEGAQATASEFIALGGPWEHTWGLTGDEKFFGVAADSAGNVFATGDAANPAEGILLAKFGPSGTLQWKKLWTPQSSNTPCHGRGIELDGSGNVYVTGHIVIRDDGKDDDLLLLKFDNDGNLIWDRSWGGGYTYFEQYNPLLEIQEIKRSEYGIDIEVNAGGDVYLTGNAFYGDWYWLNTAFPPYYFESVIEITTMILLKFDPDGTLVFQRDFFINDYSRGEGIALDSVNGLVYCAGVGLWGGQEDALVAAWDETGTLQKGYNWGGSSLDHARGLCVDPSGNVVITGETQSYGQGGYDAFVLNVQSFTNPNPIANWQRSFGGSQTDSAVGICWDSSTSQFVVGGLTNSFGNGGYDVFTATYSAAGTLGNQQAWGTTNDELAYKISLNSAYDRPLAVGVAQNTTGASWTGGSGASASCSGTWSQRTGEHLDFAYDTAEKNGSVTNLMGILDAGAGAEDALVLQFNP